MLQKPPLPVLSAILDVEDADRSIAFYRDVLGFMPLTETTVEEHGIRAAYKGSAFLAFRPVAGSRRQGGVTLNLLVSSIEVVRTVAEVAGHQLQTMELPWGGRGLIVEDPDGYRVLISEKLDPSKAPQQAKPPRDDAKPPLDDARPPLDDARPPLDDATIEEPDAEALAQLQAKVSQLESSAMNTLAELQNALRQALPELAEVVRTQVNASRPDDDTAD